MSNLISLIDLMLHKWYLGLIVSGLLEGVSIPFPGQLFVISIGHIFAIKKMSIFIGAAIFAVPYTCGAFLPYYLGNRYGSSVLMKKPINYVEKGRIIFNKYGDLSVLFTRPFGVGNYISYLAGMYHMNKIKFAVYTFLGIYGWALAMLAIGSQLGTHINNLSILVLKNLEDSAFVFLAFIVIAIFFWVLSKNRSIWRH